MTYHGTSIPGVLGQNFALMETCRKGVSPNCPEKEVGDYGPWAQVCKAKVYSMKDFRESESDELDKEVNMEK